MGRSFKSDSLPLQCAVNGTVLIRTHKHDLLHCDHYRSGDLRKLGKCFTWVQRFERVLGPAIHVLGKSDRRLRRQVSREGRSSGVIVQQSITSDVCRPIATFVANPKGRLVERFKLCLSLCGEEDTEALPTANLKVVRTPRLRVLAVCFDDCEVVMIFDSECDKRECGATDEP